MRLDDPEGVMAHANRFKGGVALVVLGGLSAEKWVDVCREVNPDVILGANGVNSMIDNLPYWMVSENVGFAERAHIKDPDDKHWADIVAMFHRNHHAGVRLINYKNWLWMGEHDEGCIKIQRWSYRKDNDRNNPIDGSFSFRDYGMGFLSGWRFHDPAAHSDQQVGTTGVQLLHMAGILGCSQVHTIGFDLCFKRDDRHHWYDYPVYRPDHFRRQANFVEYGGVKTQKVWVEGAEFLMSLMPYLNRDRLMWADHSDGLLTSMGAECTLWHTNERSKGLPNV